MTRVGIIGMGHGVFGRRSDATVQELAFEQTVEWEDPRLPFREEEIERVLDQFESW